jgi:hypothetical protein
VGELELRGIAANQLPLLEATGDLTRNPALLDRLELARLQLADPGTLSIQDVLVTFKPPSPEATPEPPSPFLQQLRTNEPETAWGAPVMLSRKDPKSGAWLPLGPGFDGPLGASFEVKDNGRALLMANDAGMELWDLETGEQELLPTEGSPEFVSICPVPGESGAPVVAYTVASEAGDALYMWENGQSRRLHPPGDAALLPWLAFEWAPDGQSLLLKWEEAPQPGAEGEKKTLTHVAWVRRNGEIGFEAALEQELPEIEPSWTASPDGSCMALGIGGSFWLWDRNATAARVLEGVGGVWGFSPDGQKIAGINQGAVYIMSVTNPELRTQKEFMELPPLMESDGKGFRWMKDRIHFEGASAEKEDGPYRETTVEVSLALLK